MDYKKSHGAGKSVDKLVDEIIWRDFFKFWFVYQRSKPFYRYGTNDRSYYNWKANEQVIEKWKQGKTGQPLIDAFMRELTYSGFMSNRGRQIVASYLTQDLGMDWRYGAHYFEEKLLDHDVTSNYGGWNAASGLGPGKVLHFNALSQSKKFDSQGKFIKMWCPELKQVTLTNIHEPWNMTLEQ